MLKLLQLFLQKKKSNHEILEKLQPIVVGERTGRNEECPCGSGKKYKKCCGQNQEVMGE